MKSKLLLLFIIILTNGCISTYKYNEIKPFTDKLDSSIVVLISTPPDGWYDNSATSLTNDIIYTPDSGKMTASALKSAFSKYASRVDVVDFCHGYDCLINIDKKNMAIM
jgi:hypothetical protein